MGLPALRRSFLFHLGAVGTKALLSARTAGAQDTPALGQDGKENRIERARRLRIELANASSKIEVLPQQTNGDSDRYPSHLANFSKGLNHDGQGIVDPIGYQLLLTALRTGKWSDFENIQLGGAAKLSNPLAAFAFSLEGADSHLSRTPAPPAFASEKQAAELIELYWQALTRDVPFIEFESNPLIAQACADLTKFGPTNDPSLNEPVTPATIFRLPLPGCLSGPYVSQFLTLNVPFDNEAILQQYSMLAAGTDALTTYSDLLNIQNGALPGPGSPLTAPRYTVTPRDLVSYVHKDFPFQADQNAALILSGFGAAALSDSNPYKHSKTQAAFVTFGLPAFLDWIGRATTSALKACWYQKWLVHRRIRPEAFGGRVQNRIAANVDFPISERLFRSDVLNSVYKAQGSYLLSQSYAEGCPLHPSYPAGHAAVAGACITILKTLFDEQFVIPNPVTPNISGDSLEPYTAEPLTIGGELNKLAANIAFSRNAAGVHWRSDTLAGLYLGEAVAIVLLSDLLSLTPDFELPLTFHNFRGDLVTVRPTIS